MNRQTHKVGGMNVGVISLLMIFMILCLTTFAVLAISTVYAEQNLSTRNQLSIEEYYTAENRGQEFLAWLDGQLISLAEQHGDAESFYENLPLALAASDLALTYDSRAHTLSLALAVSQRTELTVQLGILPPGEAARYERLVWKIKPVTDTEQEKRPIWNGETL